MNVAVLLAKFVNKLVNSEKLYKLLQLRRSNTASCVIPLYNTEAYYCLPSKGKEKNMEDNSGTKSCNQVRQKESDTQLCLGEDQQLKWFIFVANASIIYSCEAGSKNFVNRGTFLIFARQQCGRCRKQKPQCMKKN